jgi:hypothetical protein
MPQAGDIDEYGRRYFPGLGWSGGDAPPDNNPWVPGGGGGYGGTPTPSPTGGAPAPGDNPAGRGPTPGIGQPTYPGFRPTTPEGGWTTPSVRPPSATPYTPATTNDVQSKSTGVPTLATTSTSFRQPTENVNYSITNPVGRGGPSAGGGNPNPIPSLGQTGNPSARGNMSQGDIQNIVYNQQQGEARAKAGDTNTLADGGIGNDSLNPFGTEGDTYRVPGSGNSGDSWEGDSFKDQYVNINGQNMIRVGHLPQGGTDYFKDPSKVIYDQRYGYVTSPDNLTGGSHESFYDKYAPWLMMGGAGLGIGMGMAGAGALEGGLAGGGTAGVGAGLTGSGAMNLGALAAGGAAAGTPFEIGGGATGPGSGLPAGEGPGFGAEGGGTVGAGAGAGGAAAATAGSSIVNPLLRGAGAVANGILSGDTPNPSGRSNDGSGLNLGDLLGGGVGLYMANRNMQQYNTASNDLLNRGDYNSKYRPGYLEDLASSYRDPDKFLAPYKAGDDRDLENLRRQEAAKGMSFSGNEMGDLTQLQSENRQKHLMDIRKDLRGSADLGQPGNIVASAMRNLPFLFQMQANGNQLAGNLLSKIIGNKSIGDWLKGVLKGDLKWDDVPTDVWDAVGGGSAGAGAGGSGSGDGDGGWDFLAGLFGD